MFIEKAKFNHLKNRYVCSIEGPIFITAPHSKKLVRGGKDFDQKVRIHLRQLYTSYLCCKMAMQIGSNSFCFWGKTSTVNQDELDPNYLLPKMFQKNPFHQSLHYWAKSNEGAPLFHIDIHGKFDRKNNCEIDIGLLSMQIHWKNQQLVKEIKKYFNENMNSIFQGLLFNNFQCKFNTSPNLHGYWEAEMCTMNEQAILLGIPSIQLQIPRMVRKKLYKDQKLLKQFTLGLKKLYELIIKPWKQKRQLKINKQICKSFKVTVQGKNQRQQCLEQVFIFEKKEQLNLTAKYV